MHKPPPVFRVLPILVLLSVLSLCSSSSDDTAYSKSLLKFKQSLTNNPSMLATWQEPVDRLCSQNKPNWTGLLCLNGSFVGLRLENMSLGGKIDLEALSQLPLLTLSLMHNNFSGRFPPDIKRLGRLRSLFLAHNAFTGEIPDNAFSGMKGMRKVVLGNNSFTGKIPSSLLELPKLVNLQLRDNRFIGRVPEFLQPGLIVDLSNNELEGPIPAALEKQNATSFLGNTNLCGKPLTPCKPKKPYSLEKISILGFVSLAVLTMIVLIILYRKRTKLRPLKYQKSLDRRADDVAPPKSIYGKICFVRDDVEAFELEDLLRASAEILGSGSFGSSYKAVLFNGSTFVVRRFMHMNLVARQDFRDHMKLLGRLSHRNVLPVVGFHYRKQEKLLITEFVANGSLASRLHGKRKPDELGLDWPTRLRIAKGVARGLAHLHEELSGLTLPHGHLKSSNVLLDRSYEPILADYGLEPLTDRAHARKFMAAHKSPESTRCVTRKSDVWSLGILILELLTGRFPANYLRPGRGPSSDLARWVDSVAREEWMGEVFDKDMGEEGKCEEEMLVLLRIGLRCCEWDEGKRLDLKEAVERIEGLNEKGE